VAIRLYLDTNVFCRPFDNQAAMRIREETEAFALILKKIKENEASFVTSDLVLFELRRIISVEKRAKASVYLPLGSRHRSLDDESLQLAREIVANFKVAPRDSLHLAGALLMEAQYFLTCDDGVTKRFKNKPLSVKIKSAPRSIYVMNPVDFVQVIGW
jgi:predicted nucleic acid-binding protein